MATTKKTAVPDGARQPQDHKAAKAEAQGAPLVFEYGGRTYTMDPDVQRDVEFLELIGDIEDQPYLLPKLVRTMLGDEQWRQFKDAARNSETGRVDVEALAEMFQTADEALGNSTASPGS